ncbi:alpha/beta hydrolase [Ruegeria sp. MALMAid1280]|uniref:COG3904 family protein n=1 Tax=Ruegeria sp. MALMAid1280 TaxID=3411634 RepID=UPI003BA0D658
MKKPLTFIATGFVLLTACAEHYEPVRFEVQGDEIVVVGTIDHTTLSAFDEVTRQNPQIKTLVLQYIEGSVDDDSNVLFSRVVREKGFDTRVPSDGMVASGGTDLFLAGNRRVLEPGACVGVHSWGGRNNVATEIPADDPEHGIYLDYYEDISVGDAFYWYTLDAAPTDGMHWMTAAEADQYDLTTNRAPRLGAPAICDER